MLENQLDQAIWILKNNKHAAVATVNNDGTPHNTPVFFAYSKKLKYLYWISSPTSQHSQNILNRDEIFVVIYGEKNSSGLYISCHKVRVANDIELPKAQTAINNRRRKFKLKSLDFSDPIYKSKQLIYVAETKDFWANILEKDKLGNIIGDKRIKISRTDLLTN